VLTNFTSRPLNKRAYSDVPFAFMDQAAQNYLANITTIDLIENGDRTARENWQNRRLKFLLKHAIARSAFWRKRLPSRAIDLGTMKYVPTLGRKDIAAQTELEGSLMPGDDSPLSYASTGSTGAPVKVYVCGENGYYNLIRSLAQYFINDLPLDENRVQIAPATSLEKLERKSLAVESSESWAGPLSQIFRTGPAKKIVDQFDNKALIEELLKSPIGYLVCANRYINVLLDHGGINLIKKLGVKTWIHTNDYRDPEIVKVLAEVGVRSLSNYSAGEVGPIAYECSKHQGYFHVAHTNVIVECDDQTTASFNGNSLGRLLITHLHSYATPIIRYDIGDFGQLAHKCPCGHDGTTISNIFGRGKHFLRHPSGKLQPFHLSTRTLMEVVKFEEFRVRQYAVDTITVEVGGRDSITADEEAALRNYVVKATDPAFNVVIKPIRQIDWTGNPKRLFFSSTVA
jgi:phenylacetate-CoA ligase